MQNRYIDRVVTGMQPSIKASKKIEKSQYETYVILAGGRIRCLRCTAQSTRTKLQCGRPALLISRTQKCQFHGGGISSGKQTQEGRERITQSHIKHGESTQKVRLEHSRVSAQLSQLEDAMYLLNMTTSPRTRGRKPSGYKAIRSLGDIKQLILETETH
jgi:hypothetical protein